MIHSVVFMEIYSRRWVQYSIAKETNPSGIRSSAPSPTLLWSFMRIFTSWLRMKKISNFFRDAVEESSQKTDSGLDTRKEEQISRLLEIERMMLDDSTIRVDALVGFLAISNQKSDTNLTIRGMRVELPTRTEGLAEFLEACNKRSVNSLNRSLSG